MSTYLRPETVVSPRARWRLRHVIYDGGPLGGASGWSAAEGQWEDEDGHWSDCLAVRWNGNETKPLGNPHSRGQPTWFIVPEELEEPFRKTIEALTRSQRESHPS